MNVVRRQHNINLNIGKQNPDKNLSISASAYNGNDSGKTFDPDGIMK